MKINMPWYAVYTKNRHERIVNESLIHKGLNTFFPEIQVWSRRKDRKKKIFTPLFPGYVLVEAANMDNETKLIVLKTDGVVLILGKKENSEPLAVPDQQIAAIRRFLQSNLQVFSLASPKIGEPVRIVDGPLAGMEGIVASVDLKNELFIVNIEVLHRAVAVKLAGFKIAKI